MTYVPPEVRVINAFMARVRASEFMTFVDPSDPDATALLFPLGARLTESLEVLQTFQSGVIAVAAFPFMPDQMPAERDRAKVQIFVAPVLTNESTQTDSALVATTLFDVFRRMVFAPSFYLDDSGTTGGTPRHLTSEAPTYRFREIRFPTGVTGVRVPGYEILYTADIDPRDGSLK